MIGTGEHGRGRVVVVLTAVVVIVAIITSVWCWRDPAAPPPSPGAVAEVRAASLPASPAPTSKEAEAALARDGQQATDRARSEPGVFGRLLDSEGQPLAGFRILLESLEPRPLRLSVQRRNGPRLNWRRPEGGLVVTDADGGFEFRKPGHGSLAVALLSRKKTIREEFVLARGGRHEVELCLPDDLVVTSGRLLAGGEPVKSLGVRVYALGSKLHQHPDDDGVIQMILPVGSHRLQVISAFRSAEHDWVPLAEHMLHVRSTPARQQWSFHVQRCGVAIEVFERSGHVVSDFTVRFEGRSAIDPTTLTFERVVKGRSKTRIAWLPPGRWEVRIDGDAFLPVAAQQVEVLPVDCLEPLSFQVVAAEVVRLRFHTRRQKPVLVPAELLPELRSETGEVRSPESLGSEYGTHRRGLLGYRRVPLGQASLRLQDEFFDDDVRYLPFEPVAEVTTEVRSGQRNEILLEVAPRALVDLRACERGGREQLSARITVFAGARRVRSRNTRFANRWQSFLPPGEYRIVVDRGGLTRDHSIVVAKRNIRLRLRP